MKTGEALQICDGWFAYLQRQRDKSLKVQQLALLARTEPEKARQELRRLDGCSVTVYDAGRLEPAVRHLAKLAGYALDAAPCSEHEWETVGIPEGVYQCRKCGEIG